MFSIISHHHSDVISWVSENQMFSGVIHVTMVKVLQAMSEEQDSLMNMLEIFLREPVLDWIDFAQRQERVSKTIPLQSTPVVKSCPDYSDFH